MYNILTHTTWGPLYAATLVLAITVAGLKLNQKRQGKVEWKLFDALAITVVLVVSLSFLVGTVGLGLITAIWQWAEETMPEHIKREAFGFYAWRGLIVGAILATLGWTLIVPATRYLQRISLERQLDEITASSQDDRRRL